MENTHRGFPPQPTPHHAPAGPTCGDPGMRWGGMSWESLIGIFPYWVQDTGYIYIYIYQGTENFWRQLSVPSRPQFACNDDLCAKVTVLSKNVHICQYIRPHNIRVVSVGNLQQGLYIIIIKSTTILFETQQYFASNSVTGQNTFSKVQLFRNTQETRKKIKEIWMFYGTFLNNCAGQIR